MIETAGVGVSWGIAAILLYSGLIKLRSPSALREAISGFGFVKVSRSPLVFAVPGAEIVAAVAAVLNSYTAWLLPLAFAVYVTVTAVSVYRGHEETFRCACLSSTERLSKFTVARAACLLALAVAAAIARSATGATVPPDLVVALVTCAGIALSAICFSLAHQISAETSRLATSLSGGSA